MTINIDIGLFKPNWWFVSNNFLLTVCGGAFASIFVVTLCEYQKYLSNKILCENFLFNQTALLYSILFAMFKNIDEFLSDKCTPITGNLFDEKYMIISNQNIAIRSVDYVTFKKDDELAIAHQCFRINQLPKIESIVSGKHYLNIAITQANTDNLKNNRATIITSSNEIVSKTLTAYKNQINSILDILSDYLDTIDRCCNNRFQWQKQKKEIHKNYVALSEFGNFEDFLKKYGG